MSWLPEWRTAIAIFLFALLVGAGAYLLGTDVLDDPVHYRGHR